mgnify:FL=1
MGRGWLGVAIQEVDKELAESFGLDRPSGALVSRVIPDSPAYAAGLIDGDIILEFNGELIEQSSELPYRVGALKAGDIAAAVIYRNGEKLDLSFTLKNYPSEPDQLSKTQQQENRLGMVVGEISEDMLRRLNIKNGVVIEQVIGGSAARNGLQQGDVITMLNGTIIDSVERFLGSVSAIPANHSVPMRVIRDGYPMFIPFKIVE